MLFRVVGGNAVETAEVQHRYVSGFVMPVGILHRCSTAFSSSQGLRLLLSNLTLTRNVNILSIKDAVFGSRNL
jgi:predicted anti-sigma-YlaC factor YlaD